MSDRGHRVSVELSQTEEMMLRRLAAHVEQPMTDVLRALIRAAYAATFNADPKLVLPP